MNQPDRILTTFLNENEQRVQIKKDERLPNVAVFYFAKQDHTLGNVLRHSLIRDPEVMYAGYRMPHPLQQVMETRVQTTDKTDPLTAVIHALDSLDYEMQTLSNRFKHAVAQGQGEQADASEMMRLS